MSTDVECVNINHEIIIQAFNVEKTLEEFSLKDIEEFYIEYGGVTDPLGQLSSAIMDFIESVIDSAKSAIESAIYSVESSINSAINSVRDAISGVVDSIESTIESAISSIQSTMSSIVTSIENLSSTITSTLESYVSSITSSIEGIVNQIQSGFSSVITSIENISTSIQNTIENVLTNVTSSLQNIINQIQSGFTSITNTIQGIFTNIQQTLQNILTNVTTTIQGVINQIQSGFQSVLGTIQSIFTNIQQTIQNFATNVVSTIQSIVNQIQSGFQSVITTIQNITTTIQNLFQNVVTQIQNIVSQVQSGFGTIMETIQSLFTNVQQTIQNFATNVATTMQNIVTQIQSGFQSVITTIQNVITNIQQTLQNLITNVTVSIQNIASTIQSGFQSAITSIQNLYTNIQTFFQNVITQITTSIQGVSQTIQSMFTPIVTSIDWIRQQVGKIPELPSLIWEHIKPFVQPILDTIKDIPTKMAEISKAFQGFVNPLVGIAHFFDQIRQKFIDYITNIPNYFKSIADFFSDISKDPLGWFNDNVVKPLANAFSEIGKWIWEHLPDWLKNAITTAQDWFSGAKDWITNKWKDFVDWISKIPENIKNLGKYIYDNAIKPLQDWFTERIRNISNVVKFVEDKIGEFSKDPIGSISSFLGNVWCVISDAFSKIFNDMVSLIKSSINSILNVTKGITTSVFNTTTTILSNVAKETLSGIWSVISNMVNASKAIWDKVGKFLSNIIENVFKTIYDNIAKPIEEAVLDLIKKIVTKSERGQLIETFGLLGTVMLTFIGSEYLSRGMQITLRKLAGIFNQYEKKFTIRVRGSGEAKGEPVGVGAGASAGGSGGFEYTMRFNLGYPIRKIADEMEKYADEYRRGCIYGFSIWASQPIMRLANALWRNVIPVELPSLSEMREITRRHMPIQEKFEEHLNVMRRYLMLYGYNDQVISWLTTTADVEGWHIKVKDRFGQDRIVPISLLYELPSPSELCRMMIHDIFSPPNAPIEEIIKNFTNIMKMKGYVEDIAFLYYLLHYKYPSLEKLWDFACRATANLAWVTTKSEQFTWAGKRVGGSPKAPVELNAKLDYSKVESIIKNIPNKLREFIDKYLKYYAKWHDYAPFSWVEGFTSDNLIMLDLMADIPMRIDTRWMYKWGLIPDYEVLRIVVARGMHPDWVKLITQAECMNALAEERTYARTGVINAFKEGFMTYDGLSKTLSHLTDVKILGENIPVKFLDGEIKLLGLRAKYDRALDILRDYFKDLLRGVTENIIPFDGMTKSLREEIQSISKSLGLTNLMLDESYYKLYYPVANSLKKIKTIERIRYWYRYMLYRILYRFSEGFMSKDEFDETINEIVNNAKLTEEEKKVFVEIAQLMYDGFYKKTKADGILKKLARGAITIEQAKQELIKLGLTNDLADALIEKYAKSYTLSISTLLSYADEVYIPEDLITKKLETLGVPDDEKKIVLEVFKVRPIKDERAKAIRSVIERFIDGYIDEDTLMTELAKFGKLKEEIELIVKYAKIEKSLEIYKLRIDAILNKVKRGAITIDKAKNELRKYIVDEEVIDALIEKSVRTYTLSITQLMSYAEYVDIPEEYVKKKLEILGVPKDEIPIILQVFRIRPIKDERAKMIRSVIDAYINGYIDKDLFMKNLSNLGKSPREIKILTEYADFEKSQAESKLAIDAILNRLRRGAITLDQAKRELKKYVKDDNLINAMIEKYVRTSIWTPDKLVSMAEYVPVDLKKLVEKAKMFGYPEDEVNLYPAYTIARNLNEEIGRIVNELVYLYVYDIIDENTLREEIEKVRTLNGEVKKFGVDWIVIDDIEKELIIERAKLRKMREQRKS